MPTEAIRDARTETESLDRPLFGVLAHGYQPPRVVNIDLVLGGEPYHAGFSVVPEVNGGITDQVYRPILSEVEHLPPGLITSIYAPLRSYLKRSKPEVFARIQEAVRNTSDREYSVLGDPLIHVILPFLPSEDQGMLIEAGRQAFINDFGFAPKGLWLPETAVTKEVLHNAARSGYEFVPLRDSQIENIPGGANLDARHNICFVQTAANEEIAVLLGNSGLSGLISYSPWTTFNADEFMRGRQQNEQQNGWNALMMMDLERFGHYQIGADKFLKRILAIQDNYGFTPLNMRRMLGAFARGEKEKTYVDVRDRSSWSCEHALGRWTGECNCEDPTEANLREKRQMYGDLMAMNTFVNGELDAGAPGWRAEFGRMFVEFSDEIFTGGDFAPMFAAAIMDRGGDEEKVRHFLAKTEILIGLTSCGWFFGREERFEQNIPKNMIQGVRDLFPAVFGDGVTSRE